MPIDNASSQLPLKANLLHRPRLDDLFTTALLNPVTLVSGGAGLGKTQAVASYLNRSNYLSVWMKLTTLDNFTLRFWDSFVHTISLHRSQLAVNLTALGFPDSLSMFHRFLQLFTDELYIDTYSVVFVFDDFHLVTDNKILEFFRNLIAASLENINLIFISRNSDLSFFPWSSSIIDSESLRFTEVETHAYLALRNGEVIDTRNSTNLWRYTNGWPLALELTSIQMQKNCDFSHLVQLNSLPILSHIIQTEIYSKYNKQEQQFFLLLANLPFMPRKMLSAVFPDHNIETILNHNFFASFDHQADSYYLHQIFVDFLITKKQEVKDSEKLRVLTAAGDWCFHNNFLVDAVNFYELCNDEMRIVNLIQSFEGLRHSRNDANFFLQKIEQFSPEFINANPLCRIVYAMLLTNNLALDKALQQVQIAQEQQMNLDNSDVSLQLQGETLIASGLINLAKGDSSFNSKFKKASLLLPHGSKRWRKHFHLIEYSHALYITDAKENSIESYLGVINEAVLPINTLLNHVASGAEHLASAESSFFRLNFKQAQIDAYRAYVEAEAKQISDIMDNSNFLLLRIFMASGNTKKLDQLVTNLQNKALLRFNTLPCVDDLSLSWFFSEIGALDKISPWLSAYEMNSHPPISLDKDVLLYLRCLIEQKEYHHANAISLRYESILLQRRMIISLIYLYVYQVIILYNLNNVNEAEKVLHKAYELASPNNLYMPFIEFGHRTRAIWSYFKENNKLNLPIEWLNLIHTKAATYAKRRAHYCSLYQHLLTDKASSHNLTLRETELLINMSQGLTREEIASSMFLSPHTVKSMLKSTYNKLGAVNAADAIRIASYLGILA